MLEIIAIANIMLGLMIGYVAVRGLTDPWK